MFRRLLLAVAVTAGTSLAMMPEDADARGRRFARRAARAYVNHRYAPRYHAPRPVPHGRYYRAYPRHRGYGWGAPRGGVGVNFGRGGFYYAW